MLSPNRSAVGLAVLISVAMVAGCSSSDSDDPRPTDGGNDNDGGSDSANGGGTGAANPPAAGELLDISAIPAPANLDAAATAHRFDYRMNAVTGGTTTARAQLFEPTGPAPADGFPLVVWAHGTTGIANACTPSASFEDFGNEVAVGGLLDAGYAVLAPDYEGFGTPTVHPYYVRASHADAVLEAVAAAHAVDEVSLSDRWAIVGHSQGGHVALSAARAQGRAAYPLEAVVALAPGTDLVPFSERAFEAIDLSLAEGDLQDAAERTFYLNVYGAYVAHANALLLPEFDAASLFGDQIAPLIDEALDEQTCGDYSRTVADTLNEHLRGGGTLTDFEGLRRDWADTPGLAARFETDRLGDEAQAAPLLIVQGDADRQIPFAAIAAFVDEQRSLGTDISFETIPGGRHGDVARDEFGRTLDWLAERFPAR